LALSCDFLLLAWVAIQLAVERVAILFGPVGKVRDKVLDLLVGGLAQGFDAAEFRAA
jgi:hypothetical protein